MSSDKRSAHWLNLPLKQEKCYYTTSITFSQLIVFPGHVKEDVFALRCRRRRIPGRLLLAKVLRVPL